MTVQQENECAEYHSRLKEGSIALLRATPWKRWEPVAAFETKMKSTAYAGDAGCYHPSEEQAKTHQRPSLMSPRGRLVRWSHENLAAALCPCTLAYGDTEPLRKLKVWTKRLPRQLDWASSTRSRVRFVSASRKAATASASFALPLSRCPRFPSAPQQTARSQRESSSSATTSPPPGHPRTC